MEQIRIFVSHSHTDVAYCRKLVAQLRASGADVWYDEDNLSDGELSTAISRELPPRPIFVVVLSRAAFASSWVLKESIIANNLYQRDQSRIILPVTAESFNPIDAFKDGWLILEDFKRIEAPGFQPVPADEAAQRILAIAQHPSGYYQERATTADQLVTLGIGFRDQGRYPEAIEQFRSATKLDAQSFPAWHELAKLQLRVQQPENALQSVDRALAIRVDDFDALQTKIDILDALRLYADKEVYQHLLESTKSIALMKGKTPSDQERLHLINAWFLRIHCLITESP